MLSNQRRGITGISLIVAAVIGLLILTVVIFMVGKNVGNFATGKDKARTCAAACSAIGADGHTSLLKENCVDTPTIKFSIMPGKYSDITLPNNVCCCKWEK